MQVHKLLDCNEPRKMSLGTKGASDLFVCNYNYEMTKLISFLYIIELIFIHIYPKIESVARVNFVLNLLIEFV